MCLNSVDTTEVQDKFKNSIPEDGLTVYKVVEVKYGKYYPIYKRYEIMFKEGINEAYIETVILAIRGDYNEYYQSGFHFWLTKKTAKESLNNMVEIHIGKLSFTIIECKVKKEWIETIGKNIVRFGLTARAIVAKYAIFPVFKE